MNPDMDRQNACKDFYASQLLHGAIPEQPLTEVMAGDCQIGNCFLLATCLMTQAFHKLSIFYGFTRVLNQNLRSFGMFPNKIKISRNRGCKPLPSYTIHGHVGFLPASATCTRQLQWPKDIAPVAEANLGASGGSWIEYLVCNEAPYSVQTIELDGWWMYVWLRSWLFQFNHGRRGIWIRK